MQPFPAPSLADYIARRLGAESGLQQLGSMFARSFGAGSPAVFWRNWNPVYGYYLYYWCYRPLRRRITRGPAVLITFSASGFLLHDLPFGWLLRAILTRSLPLPFVTLWFLLIGAGLLLAEALTIDYAAKPLAFRLVANVLSILVPLALALSLNRVIG